MAELALMQQALGDSWHDLHPALQAHYQLAPNRDVGTLAIEYPRFMQWPLNGLRLMGVLINQRQKAAPAVVEKNMQGNKQYWKRSITLPNKTLIFKSYWQYHNGNEIIEYVNPLLGLCTAVFVKDRVLYYEGKSFVLKLGKFLLPIPEWLILGHTTIVEKGLADGSFTMDFRLTHPLFGQIYRYAGQFKTETL